MLLSLLLAVSLPFTQGWADTGLITVDDDWSGVPGIVGHRGDGLTGATGADPQAILADGSTTPVDVLANVANPAALFTGGVAELEVADPAVALQPSSTADAPHLVFSVDASGWGSIRVAYSLRDLDASDDDAVQPVALQYRVGAAGDFANLPAGFVADATGGPGLAELVTPVAVELPAEANGRPLVQIRALTANAAGSDEWVGIDDISVTGVEAVPPTLSLSVASRQRLVRALRRGIAARVSADEAASLRAELRIPGRLARRLRLPVVVGAGAGELAGPGTTRLTARFTPRARRRLAALRAFRVMLRVRATDAAGNVAVAGRRLVLVRL